MPIHPTFYLDTLLWETEEGIQAKSLRALQLRLQPDTRIKDYYPKGFSNVVKPQPKAVTLSFIPVLVEMPKVVTNYLVQSANAPSEEVLQELASVEFPGKNPKRRYRYTGALVHPKKGWGVEDDQSLKKLLAQNLDLSSIADQLGRSKNSIIGRCHRLKIFPSHRNKKLKR